MEVNSSTELRGKKPKKRKMTYVQVSYNSGSDGDIESDDGLDKRMQAKKPFKRVEQKQPSTLDSGNDADEEDAELLPGEGWANAMANILKKEAPQGESVVLAKSKDFAKAKEEEKKEYLERLKEKQSKKKWENMAKAKPKVTDREHERNLQRIATKGVVQLFNAVRKQQKVREEKMKEVGGSQRKRAKVEASLTKGDFLDLLKETPAPSKTEIGPRSSSVGSSSAGKKTEANAEQPSWGVLRDDFMLGADMKDWDKEDDSENDVDMEDNSEEADSGLSSDSD